MASIGLQVSHRSVYERLLEAETTRKCASLPAANVCVPTTVLTLGSALYPLP